MQNNHHNRQLDIFRPTDAPILVIGAGGIGSITTFALAKMGCSNITVVDYDTVEEHNIGSQFFSPNQLGMTKLDALADNVLTMTGVSIKKKLGYINSDGYVECDNVVDDVFESETAVEINKYDIIIMAVDSMKARKMIYPAIKDKFELLIDGRMGGQVFNIYSFYNFEAEDYPSSWPEDSEILRENCTAKAICFNTFAIASFIAGTVKKYHKSEEILKSLDGCLCNFFINYTNEL